jgi:hypothetical protein
VAPRGRANGQRGGRVPIGGGQHGRHGNGPAVVRAGGAAWPRRATGRTGEGEDGLAGGP